ncbi:hypothetical protein H5J24_17115 [Chryseobacterium capnotolerans]|uniref:hypothetical protein n=1 Tax=Chryseobacterium TaxID=59732 RepID=UPI001142D6A0|nr:MULTISPECIES: hypothetical protein [Chryseobacterium]UHO37416.1 hypothetical protein H5J24_17115 [Chryseobacterium capnotolerans]
MYSNANIITNAGGAITEAGLENGVSYGDPKKPPFIEFETGVELYIEFEPLPAYNGEFGFDWLTTDSSDNVLKIQTDDIANLEFVYDEAKQEYVSTSSSPDLKSGIKKDYNKFPLKVPYYIPWLSLMKLNQEIKLNMICKPIKAGDDISKAEISFGKNECYEVDIDGKKNENIKYTPDGKPKEITIKCIKASKDVGIVAVDKEKKEIGKITAVDNTKIYDLSVRLVCVVKDSPNKETEISQLISDFKTDKIEEYLNQNSLNQALIKTTVEIDSKYRIAFDETAWNGTFYNKTGNYFTNRKDPAGGKVSYVNDDGEEQKDAEYEHILDKFLREYKTAFETDGKKFKGILLFISNIKKDPADQEGGVSRTKPVNFREAIVFASNLKDKSTYAHEIAHALGLEHYFWRDPDYTRNLDELKNNIKANEKAITDNKNNIKTSENNIKILNDNIKIHQNNIKEYEAYQKTHPNYYKENPKVASFVKDQKEKINKANEDIKKAKDNIKDNQDTNKKIEKALINQKNNLEVYKSNKYKFKEKSTLNIMDYSSKTNIYTKWQWDIMQNDVKSYYGSTSENK